MTTMNPVRRVILSLAAPALVLALVWNLQVRVDVLETGLGFQWTDAPLRDQTWFRALFVVAVAVYWWVLWPARAVSGSRG